jgi:chorismate lyase/3-hydroxybenzoate synthase
VQCGAFGDVRFAHNGVALFAAISDPVPVDQAAFEQRTAEGYENLFAVLAQQGYPHLLRVWNYFPQINVESLGLENYRRFCRGRGEAFLRHFGDAAQHFPAASALGTRSGQLHIYALASREPGKFCENPRQTSAYLYPPEYGPRSPTFARATLTRWDGVASLYVSGTASIVGHESRHPGDCVAQLDETLRNIEALLVATGREEGCGFEGLAQLTRLKVYLRDATNLAAVRARLNAVLAPGAQTIYLQADVCRSDLLVEIEAVAMARA